MTSATATTLSAMPHNGNEVCVYLHQTKDHNDKTHTLMVPRSATVVDLHKAVRSTLRLCSLTPLALAVGENTLSTTVTMEDLLIYCNAKTGVLHVLCLTEDNMGLLLCGLVTAGAAALGTAAASVTAVGAAVAGVGTLINKLF
uniref:Xanthine phosphoribosyltransferase n=1 Tax=Lygus hesperus TaxID=30085 RepID=A0A0A9XNQ2_LYGHE